MKGGGASSKRSWAAWPRTTSLSSLPLPFYIYKKSVNVKLIANGNEGMATHVLAELGGASLDRCLVSVALGILAAHNEATRYDYRLPRKCHCIF